MGGDFVGSPGCGGGCGGGDGDGGYAPFVAVDEAEEEGFEFGGGGDEVVHVAAAGEVAFVFYEG